MRAPERGVLALYHGMTTPQLREMRAAFTEDRAHAGAVGVDPATVADLVAFCDHRIVMIDAVLQSRDGQAIVPADRPDDDADV